MQVVTALDSSKDKEKRPSVHLWEKIKSCVSMFRSLNETVNEVIELGRKEGFSPLEIGQFIRTEMLKAGLHRSTAARYLPAELKNKPRGKQISVSRNLRQNQPPTKNMFNATKEFVFKGRISKASRDRHAIVIGADKAKDLKPFLGKEIQVTISILR